MGYGSISAEGVSRGPSPQEGRAQMLQSVVLESFKIAGVSFEDRQDLVKQLTPGKAAT